MSVKEHTANHPSTNNVLRVGIIGGGVSGSTIALRLAALGVQTYLFEKKASLIDGPPMCHLHAGGNLYREIPDEDCIILLKQSIDMLRLYPYSIDRRPTLIAIPLRDKGDPADLLPRLELLTQVYSEMIAADKGNKVLGDAKEYYRLYSRSDLETLLKKQAAPSHAFDDSDTDAWVAAAAEYLDLDKLKYPLVAVMEYGWNIFRLAASAQQALQGYPNVQVLLNTTVKDVSIAQHATDKEDGGTINPATISNDKTNDGNTSDGNTSDDKTNDDKTNANTSNNEDKPSIQAVAAGVNQTPWHIHYVTQDNASENTLAVDYLINAGGFRTGIIDDMVGVTAKKMVEFKASYIAHWDLASGGDTPKTATMPSGNPPIKLPEIIIHGERGTPQGMVQLTPYPDGFYQIHSMSKQVTLFSDGLVTATPNSAQPNLKPVYLNYIDHGWDKQSLQRRSQRAIEQVSEFVPRFASARPTNNALYGGQQIPGVNDSRRVADVSLYADIFYARAESVKASSALAAADEIVQQLQAQGLLSITPQLQQQRQQQQWPYLAHTTKQDIDAIAKTLTLMRRFPTPMAGVVTPYQV